MLDTWILGSFENLILEHLNNTCIPGHFDTWETFLPCTRSQVQREEGLSLKSPTPETPTFLEATGSCQLFTVNCRSSQGLACIKWWMNIMSTCYSILYTLHLRTPMSCINQRIYYLKLTAAAFFRLTRAITLSLPQCHEYLLKTSP